MSQILTGLFSPNLASVLQNNILSFYAHYCSVPKREFYSDFYLARFFTDVSSPLMNGVLPGQIPLDKIDTIIEENLNYFRTKQIAMAWWVGKETQPADLGKYLEAHGLQCIEEMPAMAIDLSILLQEPVVPKDLVVSQVQDQVSLEHWVQIAGVSFEFPPVATVNFLELELSIGFTSKKHIRFLAYWEGIPVATTLLHLDGQIAGIYVVATVPEARRKGIATKLVTATLQYARQLGYHIATLQATHMGINIYRRIGFEEFYPLHLYSWK